MKATELTLKHKTAKGAGLFVHVDGTDFWMKPAQTSRFEEKGKVTLIFDKAYKAAKEAKEAKEDGKQIYYYVSDEKIAETDKAILLRCTAREMTSFDGDDQGFDKKVWFPKSQIRTFDREQTMIDGSGKKYLETCYSAASWLCKKHNLSVDGGYYA